MSNAYKRTCDRCDDEFQPELGCLSIDVNFYTDVDTRQGWSEIDLCLSCSKPIIEQIRPACIKLEDILPADPPNK